MSEKTIKLEDSKIKFLFRCLDCAEEYYEEFNTLYILLSKKGIPFRRKCISCGSYLRIILDYKESIIIGTEAVA